MSIMLIHFLYTHDRFHHGAIVFNSRLYVIGGNDWENSAKDSTFMLEPGAESWVTKQPMHIPRVGVGLAIVGWYSERNVTSNNRDHKCRLLGQLECCKYKCVMRLSSCVLHV